MYLLVLVYIDKGRAPRPRYPARSVASDPRRTTRPPSPTIYPYIHMSVSGGRPTVHMDIWTYGHMDIWAQSPCRVAPPQAAVADMEPRSGGGLYNRLRAQRAVGKPSPHPPPRESRSDDARHGSEALCGGFGIHCFRTVLRCHSDIACSAARPRILMGTCIRQLAALAIGCRDHRRSAAPCRPKVRRHGPW